MALLINIISFPLVLLSIVHVSTLQDLGNVPKRLKDLASKLNHDVDIQESIYVLADNGQTVANSFSQMLKDHGNKILKEKNNLIRSSSPESVDTDALKKTLTGARESLLLERMKIENLQTDIHVNIENCNSRKRQLDIEKRDITIKLDTIPEEIRNLDDDINMKEESIRASEQRADSLETQAHSLRKEAEKRQGGGAVLGTVFGAVAGALLAPYTGFATLTMIGGGGFAGILVGSLLDDADKYERKARDARSEAHSELSRARSLEWKKVDLQSEKESLERDTHTLQSKSDDIKLAFSGLQDITVYLRSSIDTIDKVLDAIQDMDTALKDADLQNDHFSIVKKAFAGRGERFEEKSNIHLAELKKKWERLEEVLLLHGTRSRLT